ncbi:unnamed protein product [Rotaria sordida]|uniref:C3H1-type domain-containing protein n=1 Tax=Rotaria sordida TaxID=392033 RepID=A0A819C6Z8_9BILA|nr:unnamed protein product [Rotaria sordida]
MSKPPPHSQQNRGRDRVRQLNRYQYKSTNNLLEFNSSNASTDNLCKFANKGICQYADNECRYSHIRCSNYNSCYKRGCPLAHAFRRTNSMSSLLCRNGIDCFTSGCKYRHPSGWNACIHGINCKNYDCQANHPPDRQQRCLDAYKCEDITCPYLHPAENNNSLELDSNIEQIENSCPFGSCCYQDDCKANHPCDRISQLQGMAPAAGSIMNTKSGKTMQSVDPALANNSNNDTPAVKDSPKLIIHDNVRRFTKAVRRNFGK